MSCSHIIFSKTARPWAVPGVFTSLSPGVLRTGEENQRYSVPSPGGRKGGVEL